MTRGTKFLSNSKCACGTCGRTDRPYGHMTGSGGLYLKGYCHRCNKVKSLPYTQQQLEMEGEGIRKFFKNVWNKALKPVGKHVGKNIISNPTRALQVASQVGAAAASKNPTAILNAGAQLGQFGFSGKGAVKIGELTNGGALYLHRR